MFSKSKTTEPATKTEPKAEPVKTAPPAPSVTSSSGPQPSGASAESAPSTAPQKSKPAPSVISTDLTITGNITTSGDVQVDGTIEGDIHAHLLTVGEGSTISGEVMADDIVVHGHVKGRVRGLKVRLTSTARVEGDIIHKTIAIESGAHFEGSVQRSEDPLKNDAKSGGKSAAKPGATAPASAGAGASDGESGGAST